MLNIHTSSKFRREYKKLPKKIKELLKEKEKIFFDNPRDARLKTHKLSGPLGGLLAFSVNYQYRVVFTFKDSETVLLYSVGDHDVYD